MLSGDVLSQWLQRRNGSVVAGSRISLTRGGFLRVSEEVNSRPVQVALPVMHGGQAAVARAVDSTGAVLALRVQAVSSTQEKARQMERLVNMTTVATAARDRPDRFPAVLPVLESFVVVVPGTEMPVTGPQPEYELWCDLMAWCPHDLNDWQQAPGQVRTLPVVLGAFLPVLATVHAAHEDLGIVHRDITPNNVLVDEQGRLLLADWGIAHGLDAGQTSTYTQLVGNRGFSLPPEMLAGDPSVGRYTDAWYLGSLLAWMLTGQPPGPQHGPTWLPPGMPDGPAGEQVAAVVQGLCHPDPRGRLDLPQAWTHLAAAAQGHPMAPPVLPAVPDTVVVNPTVAPTAPVRDGSLAGVTVGPAPAARSKKPLWATLGVVGVCAALVAGALVWQPWDSAAGSGGSPSGSSGGASEPSLEGEACLVGTWEASATDALVPRDLLQAARTDREVKGSSTLVLKESRSYSRDVDILLTWTDESSTRQETSFYQLREGSYSVDGDTVVLSPTFLEQRHDDEYSSQRGDVIDTTWTYTCSGSTLTVLTWQNEGYDKETDSPMTYRRK
ncbi:MAG: hypothetical protein FWH11_02590 [Micrococcales bacterium]|nr:hypothetical protein [Micrococcales bacterium]